MDNRTKIWELIAKKSADEATTSELETLEQLLRAETDMPEIKSLDVLQKYWEELHAAPENQLQQSAEILLENNFENVRGDNAVEFVYKRNFFLRNWWKIAASVVIALGIGIYFTVHQKPKIIEIVSGKGERKELLLPDGTKVWLNTESQLSYATNYLQSENRYVTLSGEAYFDVKHNEKHRFIIHTKFGINIQDVGTIFNVKAYPTDKTMETTLIKGSIEIFAAQTPQNKLLLRPNEKFILYKAKKLGNLALADISTTPNTTVNVAGTVANCNFEISKIAPLINKGDSLISETAWTQNELAFNAEPLSELAGKLARWYNVTINVNDSAIGNYRFTGVFDGETLTEALDELKMIRPFNYEIKDSTVTINKKKIPNHKKIK
jgi:ferric-dicitrate binding protein FerR (iron transport regulator)